MAALSTRNFAKFLPAGDAGHPARKRMGGIPHSALRQHVNGVMVWCLNALMAMGV